MTGFEAITHYNGWMMAILGAVIVFSGLAVLSLIISQLPKIFALFEREAAAPPVEVPSAPTVAAPEPAAPPHGPDEPEGTVLQIAPLAATLQAPFQLSELYRLCREKDLPHPHLSLSRLQQQGILHPEGDGAFTWRVEGETPQEG